MGNPGINVLSKSWCGHSQLALTDELNIAKWKIGALDNSDAILEGKTFIEEVVKVHRASSGKHLKFIKLFGQNNWTIMYNPIVLALMY